MMDCCQKKKKVLKFDGMVTEFVENKSIKDFDLSKYTVLVIFFDINEDSFDLLEECRGLPIKKVLFWTGQCDYKTSIKFENEYEKDFNLEGLNSAAWISGPYPFDAGEVMADLGKYLE